MQTLDHHFACFHIELETKRRYGDGIGDVRPCDDHREEILMAHMWLLVANMKC